MASSSIDYQTIAQTGVAAWQRGDALGARRAFDEVVSAGRASPQLWLLLAQACEALGDLQASDQALDAVLAGDPRNPYALLMKGDHQAALGDDRAANSWYNMALSSAAQIANLPQDLIARLDRAQSVIAAAAGRFESHLSAALAKSAIDPAGVAPRFAESIDIITGRREVFLQQPTSFFYPGLPHTQFFENDAFTWVAALEAAAPAMRKEVEAILGEGVGLSPYVVGNQNRPTREHTLLNDPNWSAFYLWENGALVADNAARCPNTMAALIGAPIPHIAGRSPMVLFSVLRPHTHIPSHNGVLNTRLICHIPLVVPPDCRLRVGNETRTVEFGKAMIFDDSIEHEAWNDSDETRIILLFEIWRPELSDAERRALTVMYEAINAYPGAPAS
ncbi:MAG: aspartyl/asparaginyl beta-hydroxylase domain-containing protein [Pseudomonadota bacterium]